MYEIATFWQTHGLDRMDFVPVMLCPFLAIMFLLANLVFLFAAAAWDTPQYALLMETLGYNSGLGFATFWALAYSVPYILVTYLLALTENWHAEHIDDLIATFSLETVECTVESDRQIVYNAIVERYGTLGHFERLVRVELRQAVQRALGSPGSVPTVWLVMTFMPELCAVVPHTCLTPTLLRDPG